jgi:hypothetical protein
MNPPARRIQVVIDELVLHSVDPHHGHTVAEALRAELAATLGAWRPPAGAHLDHVDAGAVPHPGPGAPRALGQAVARHITAALPQDPAPGGSPR